MFAVAMITLSLLLLSVALSCVFSYVAVPSSQRVLLSLGKKTNDNIKGRSGCIMSKKMTRGSGIRFVGGAVYSKGGDGDGADDLLDQLINEGLGYASDEEITEMLENRSSSNKDRAAKRRAKNSTEGENDGSEFKSAFVKMLSPKLNSLGRKFEEGILSMAIDAINTIENAGMVIQDTMVDWGLWDGDGTKRRGKRLKALSGNRSSGKANRGDIVKSSVASAKSNRKRNAGGNPILAAISAFDGAIKYTKEMINTVSYNEPGQYSGRIIKDSSAILGDDVEIKFMPGDRVRGLINQGAADSEGGGYSDKLIRSAAGAADFAPEGGPRSSKNKYVNDAEYFAKGGVGLGAENAYENPANTGLAFLSKEEGDGLDGLEDLDNLFGAGGGDLVFVNDNDEGGGGIQVIQQQSSPASIEVVSTTGDARVELVTTSPSSSSSSSAMSRAVKEVPSEMKSASALRADLDTLSSVSLRAVDYGFYIAEKGLQNSDEVNEMVDRVGERVGEAVGDGDGEVGWKNLRHVQRK